MSGNERVKLIMAIVRLQCRNCSWCSLLTYLCYIAFVKFFQYNRYFALSEKSEYLVSILRHAFEGLIYQIRAIYTT